MALTDFESHDEAVAERAKGDVTEAPLAGVLTLIVLEPLEPVLWPVTVIATSVSHAAPWRPQAFTCRVCFPVEAVTVARTVVLSTTVVPELLSSE